MAYVAAGERGSRERSLVLLDENRDFTVATVAAPTTFVEETPVTEEVEGEVAEGEVAEGEAPEGAEGGDKEAPAEKK